MDSVSFSTGQTGKDRRDPFDACFSSLSCLDTCLASMDPLS